MEELKKWLKKQKELGRTKKEITSELLTKGWNLEAISSVIDKFFIDDFDNIPTPPIKKNIIESELLEKYLNKEINLDPKYKISIFIVGLFQFLFLSVLFFVTNIVKGSHINTTTVIYWFVFFILFILLTSVYANLYYKSYKFKLTEKSYTAERGIIWKRYISIPYNRIQNIDLYRGPLARILGLSDLNIQTAGYSSNPYSNSLMSEGRLPGLNKKTANEIKEILIQLSSNSDKNIL